MPTSDAAPSRPASTVLGPMNARVLTPELAAEIADETTRILGHNVLITDENARVIGSGDVSRVGTIHEASVEVVKSGVAASHNTKEAAALVGVRPGITMPIVLDGAVIGTVGITGSPAQVVRLGRRGERQNPDPPLRKLVLRPPP